MKPEHIIGVVFALAIGLFFGVVAGLMFQDWVVCFLIALAGTGFSIDVIFRGTACRQYRK